MTDRKSIPEPLRFRVFEFVRRMSSGLTAPLLCAASLPDGSTRRVVLKLREPGTPRGMGHYGATSLAAELVTATIAKATGLEVPDYGVAEVDARFAGAIADPDMSALLHRNIGPNFATVLITDGTILWQPSCRSSSSVLRQTMDNVMSLDATVINGDRKKQNPNLLWDGGDRVFLIDHSLAASAYLWDDPTILSSPLFPEKQVRAHSAFDFLSAKRCGFTEVHAAWQRTFSSVEWADLRRLIPREWEARPGDLERMFGFLSARASRFNDIAVNLRILVT